MIWATGNLSMYKLVDLSRCKFLIVLTPFLKGLGWVAEAGSGKTRLKGTVNVIGGCGQHMGNSGWVARAKPVTAGQMQEEERMDLGHQMCYSVQLLGCTIEEGEVKYNLRIKWTKEPQVEISSGEKG